jgi:hypothetical protein
VVQGPFTWTGRELTDEERRDRGIDDDDPPPVYGSRFPPGLEQLAHFYRSLLRMGIDPPVVDQMRPSQIAAVLRLDETDEVIAGAEPIVARAQENVPAPELPPVDESIPRAERLKDHIRIVDIVKG